MNIKELEILNLADYYELVEYKESSAYLIINKKIEEYQCMFGFLTDSAKKNIDELVKDFNLEHEYINFNKDLLHKVYHHSMKHWLVPCIACAYIGYATMIEYSNKIDAGICIHGRSKEQMLRYYNKDIFSTFINL